ncbi:hypothetical protein KAFR_0H02080 [Kazachstania africana CBS 2517]|uniref:DUF2415 domain-containing protein n=1 Tax=Kazachstania africana (strain ATCC 22294 / BCRC 22015 / CBS 2517 / CECT 1963 / NBRC 1671 / NRRL Y-8276) TaxID=1071382 RepID=H2AZ61_KAZAF|nr:hypothetical protein KAFR_0H02080 [Kazachstania africana CBS 2517]CCF59617.1 hypothetical protein KAFR_0H02080 [Kazachstania africana CBS 2517]
MTILRHAGDCDELDDEKANTGSDKIYQNYLMPGLEMYDAKVTINHWQLRDCVKPSSVNGNKLFYIFDHSIRTLNTATARPLKHDSIRWNDNAGKIRSTQRRRRSITHKKRNKKEIASSAPTEQLVEFNFKPRCFVEKDGLLACGGLVGSDDKGFPTNWSRISHENDNLSSPAQPVKVSSANVIMDNSNYSNPNIWKGILSLYNQETNVSETVILGQFINNCVTLYPRSKNDYNLYTCNNDGQIYQCNVSNRNIELVKRYSDLNFPLNNAALSNDGKMMVVSGDSNKFAVYKQDEMINQFSLNWDNGDNLKIKSSTRSNIPDQSEILDINNNNLKNNNNHQNGIYEAQNGDHGFYNCFSENDLQFATLFQNGVCLLYDIRNLHQPLGEIFSTRPHSHNGAFRVCKFSHGLDDLLCISEHQSRVHIMDTRNLTNHQVIMIPDKLVNESDLSESQRRRRSSHNHSNNPVDLNILPISSSASISNALYESPQIRTNYSFSTGEITTDDPWITSANKVPLQYLQPVVVPFPRLRERSAFPSPASSSSSSSSSSSLSNIFEPQHARRSSNFTVRRVSTTSSNNEDAILPKYNDFDDNQENQLIDPQITSSRRNSRRRSTRRISDHILDIYSTSNDDDTDNNDPTYGNNTRNIFDDFQQNSRGFGYRIGRVGEQTEENNICGVDWIEDNLNGSSLVIGTDYGIMRWNINSWARRSFSSYDLC